MLFNDTFIKTYKNLKKTIRNLFLLRIIQAETDVILSAGTKEFLRKVYLMNVYDFDNTIYRGESGVDLFLGYLKKDPRLLRMFPMAVKCIYKYKTGKMSLDEVMDKYAGVVENFAQTIEDIESDVIDFWDKNSNKIKSFYLKQRQDDDIIISACLDVVLEEICRRLNIKNFVGSKTDLESRKLVDFCFRENKVKVFKEKFPDAEIDNFYTDSLNDQPMIDLARNAYLVKGDRLIKIK